MTRAHRARWRIWAAWGFGVVVAVLGALALWRFPWRDLPVSLVQADAGLLLAALIVNLSSLVAKGWGWQLLMGERARGRWRLAQEANLVGSAVNNLSVSFIGESARVHYMARRARLALSYTIASVVWARAAEALALALLLLVCGAFLEVPTVLRALLIGLGVGVPVLVALAWPRRQSRSVRRFIPHFARSTASALAQIGSLRRLPAPVLLALYSWLAEWATFHLALRAVHAPVTLAASLVALVSTNLGGALRLLPANLGVLQASMAIGLLPFGVPAYRAVAGGIVLQAVQVLPVLALASALLGWKGLRRVAGEPLVTIERPTSEPGTGEARPSEPLRKTS